MAQEPPTKFESSDHRRPRRLEDAKTAELGFPLVWIIIGGLAGLIVIGLIGLGVVNFVRQGAITPTPQVLPPIIETVETPPVVENTPVVVETPTLAPTEVITSDVATASPEESTTAPPETTEPIEVNGYVKVIGTDGVGVSMRAGPGRNNARVGIAEEDENVILLVVNGPRLDDNSEDYMWWYIQHPDGTVGWVVEDFLLPVEAP